MRQFLLAITLSLLSACANSQLTAPIADHAASIHDTFKVSGGPRGCVDALAGATYPKELRAIPNHISVGMFLTAFSSPEQAMSVIKGELAAGREHMRINLLWSDTHNYGSAKDVQFITMWSKELGKLCAVHPGKLQIAPFTEHKIANPDQFLSIVKVNAPHCGRPVNSAWTGGFTTNPAFENEVHGEKTCPGGPEYKNVPCSYSYDGTNAVDDNVTARKAKFTKAARFCVWWVRDNLRWNEKDPTPRPQRIKEASKRKPTKDGLLSQVWLLTDKGQTSLPKKWTLKSHAENHGPGPNGQPDAKGDKLLIISPEKVVDKKGKVKPIILREVRPDGKKGKKVCSLGYYGPFDGTQGTFRYYAPVMGFRCGANREVWIGNRKFGVVNAGFRDGTYR